MGLLNDMVFRVSQDSLLRIKGLRAWRLESFPLSLCIVEVECSKLFADAHDEAFAGRNADCGSVQMTEPYRQQLARKQTGADGCWWPNYDLVRSRRNTSRRFAMTLIVHSVVPGTLEIERSSRHSKWREARAFKHATRAWVVDPGNGFDPP